MIGFLFILFQGSKELYVARAQTKTERQQILGSLYGGSNNDLAKNKVL